MARPKKAQQKPVSIKRARKKKQEEPIERIYYPLPEGDDWKPDGWKQFWAMVYQDSLPYMLEYVMMQKKQAA